MVKAMKRCNTAKSFTFEVTITNNLPDPINYLSQPIVRAELCSSLKGPTQSLLKSMERLLLTSMGFGSGSKRSEGSFYSAVQQNWKEITTKSSCSCSPLPPKFRLKKTVVYIWTRKQQNRQNSIAFKIWIFVQWLRKIWQSLPYFFVEE